LVVAAAFDGEGALADGWEEVWWLEEFGDEVAEAESFEGGLGEDDGIEGVVGGEFEAGFDVTANGGDFEVWSKGEEE
jgi:hypothetical protein